MHYTRSRTWTIAIELAIPSTPLFRHDTTGPRKTNQPISSVQITPTISKASNIYLSIYLSIHTYIYKKRKVKKKKQKQKIKKTTLPKNRNTVVSHVRVSQVATKQNRWMIWLTVNHCSPLLPRMPWIVSRIIEAGWTAVTRLAKCSKDARQREKRKRKERKPVRWYTVPRSSTNCVALRPPSLPSRAHRRVRLCSAPFPRPAAEMRRAAARSPLPATFTGDAWTEAELNRLGSSSNPRDRRITSTSPVLYSTDRLRFSVRSETSLA